MKTQIKTIISTLVISLTCYQTAAQIKFKKPSIDIKSPVGKNSEPEKVKVNGKDPSGLFSNCTDDANARSYRIDAVNMLNTLETEYKKDPVDYNYLSEKFEKNEKTLANLFKIEPNVNADTYNERYLPLKKRFDEEFVVFKKLKALEKNLANEYSVPIFLNEGKIEGYSYKKECYCNHNEKVKSFEEFSAIKKQYEELNSKLVNYVDEIARKKIANMAKCVEAGNKYTIWMAKENLDVEVISFNKKEKPLMPESVIEKCKKYTDALVLIETDKSLNLSTEAKTALTDAKKQVAQIKSDAESYISSGDFEKYKAKVYAEKIAKEFLPKAVATNAVLSTAALKYVMGQEMKTYITEKLGRAPVASTIKANLTTEKPEIVKNNYAIPKYKYHVIWVAFKDTDGKCFKTAVYATYNYLGGGTYETTPTYGADAPIEMACVNVNK